MRFKRLAASLLLSLSCPLLWAQEDSAATLTAKPNKCIALNRGQACYQTVRFYWHTPAAGDYCLFAEGQPTPLHCWQGAGAPPFQHEFVGQQSQGFFIRTPEGQTLAQLDLVVAWVYTSGRRDSG
ncbi:MAG TPA: DUF3019 domain-containing protein, partial [Cellvibrionaceae bacterium]|nr:DUF3019 domain-containing protein [Cellvibrionaceae bacterium]